MEPIEIVAAIGGVTTIGLLVALIAYILKWKKVSDDAGDLRLRNQELKATLTEERSDYHALSEDHARITRELAAEKTRSKLKANNCAKELDKVVSDAMEHGINPMRLAEMLSRTRQELAR